MAEGGGEWDCGGAAVCGGDWWLSGSVSHAGDRLNDGGRLFEAPLQYRDRGLDRCSREIGQRWCVLVGEVEGGYGGSSDSRGAAMRLRCF
ncbi:hypothetical protein SESBI_47639 [Sesbania bispinosa]|nr:hypothetical protein SESBI_47639 [Sesbania bispinosa]